MAFFTYIMASRRNGTLYIGHTEDMAKRLYEHREKLRPGFTAKYAVTQLVWYEIHDTRDGALARERAMKEWKRRWKLELIERHNPGWRDLAGDFFDTSDQVPAFLASLDHKKPGSRLPPG